MAEVGIRHQPLHLEMDRALFLLAETGGSAYYRINQHSLPSTEGGL